MCDACQDFNDAAGTPARQRVAMTANDDVRERVAKLLTASDGLCPETLVANTLDEEPVDGVLACGQEAHFAWRQRLRRADGLCSQSGHAALIADGIGIPAPARRAVRHVIPATLAGQARGTSPA